MYRANHSGTTLHVGTIDGIFTLRLGEGGDRGSFCSASLRASPIRTIALDPLDPDVLLVGCGGPGSDLYYSRDGGLTWESPGMWPPGREVWALAFDPADPRVVLAGTQPAGIHRSQDRGYTWEEMRGIQNVAGRSAWTFSLPPHEPHVRKLAFDPSHQDVVLAAVEVGGVLLSEDGGRTWQGIGDGVDRDVHSVAFWPGDSQIMFAATGAGLYRSEDRGRSWLRVSPRLVGDYVLSLGLQKSAPHLIFSAGRCNGEAIVSRSDDGGHHWVHLGTGLPAPERRVDSLVIHPNEPETLFYGCPDPSQPERGSLFASRDGGRSWAGLSLDVALPPVITLAICCAEAPLN